MRGLLLAALLAASGFACALDSRFELGLEGTAFGKAGAQGQERAGASASARAEIWKQWNEGRDTATFVPFARVDSMDSQRSHVDIRQLDLVHAAGAYEFRAGIRQVFWGVTEGAHLVDIINQTDQVESLDGEQKLGQPMLNLAWERGAHALDIFTLIGARERTFAGQDGRLRLPLVVDEDLAQFESGRGKERLDLAARYQFNEAGLRLGFSGFHGTAREPELRPVVDPARLLFAGPLPIGFQPGYAPVLAPYYSVITQWGLDAQYTAGDWLWKLEAIDRAGMSEHYRALDAGFEFTQVGVLGSSLDLGWLAEFLHDSRGDNASTPFESDLLLGSRLAFNDVAGSELLAYVVVDTQSREQLWTLEGSRRLGESLKLALEARVFAHTPSPQDAFAALMMPDREHKLRSFAEDDFLRATLTWFF